ncbi:MAG: branched-chain amino acid ABC transporter permease [Deltaproteobacteria bacterium]|nr:branched-chain amino acid ABC transporter permease [Deltaproteobacteria bacterium]
MENILNYIIAGLANGCIYSLVAIGFVLIYKSSGILNFAQGTIVILNAFVFYSFTIQLGIPMVIAILLTLAFGALLGFVIERFILDRLIGQPILAVIILTLAFSEFLKGIMNLGWGTDILSAPQLFPRGNITILNIVTLDYSRIAFLVITFFLIIIFAIFYNKTKIGLAMKATSDDTIAAGSVGIRVRRVFVVTWIISCITAAAGGILVTNVMGIHIQVAEIGFKAMAVALVGGLQSLPGIIIIGPAMGIIEFLSAAYLDPLVDGGMRDLVPFIILLIVLIFRPSGIFGWKHIERI